VETLSTIPTIIVDVVEPPGGHVVVAAVLTGARSPQDERLIGEGTAFGDVADIREAAMARGTQHVDRLNAGHRARLRSA
jgi:hypothetical protein